MADLVSRGRYPHQSLLKQWTQADKQAVEAAMAATNVSQLADRSVDELSGGQRQRVWVAMALAQQTPLLLLDEPTTYLDIAQIEAAGSVPPAQPRGVGQTLIAVLHDLNHACRYADHIIAMRDGKIVAEGKPVGSSPPNWWSGCSAPCMIIDDPLSHTPLVIPRGRYHCTTRLRHEKGQG